MKIAYFDCFAGISGDMILGALLDCGLDEKLWREKLSLLPISGYEIKVSSVLKHHLTGKKVDINIKNSQKHRNLKDILKIINDSSLESDIKEKASLIFNHLATAEGKVHGKSAAEVHFHEVGAVDAILDVVGAVIGLKLLGIEEIYASALPLTHGFVESEHGKYPVPGPATLELLKNYPVKKIDIEGELVTPTGAAIVTSLAKFSPNFDFKLEKTGYGAGTSDFKEIPNFLRVLIGESMHKFEEDEIIILETNLDNTQPELIGYIVEKLLSQGALDAFLTPVIMKKSRPGVILTVLAEKDNYQKLLDIIFKESFTTGVRIQSSFRKKLPRKIEEVETKFGKAKVKIAGENNFLEILPEFEDCKILAERNNVPLKIIYEEIRKVYLERIKKK